jgi:DNA repair exonuclease SbcCD ATPase subunit
MRYFIFGLIVLVSFILGYQMSQFRQIDSPSERHQQAGQAPTQRTEISTKTQIQRKPSPAPVPPSVPQASVQELENRQKTVSQLDQKVSQLERAQSVRQARLDQLQNEIAAQQNQVSQLKSEFEQRAQGMLESYRDQFNQQAEQQAGQALSIAQLEEQMTRSASILRELNQKIQSLSSYGFEPDSLRDARLQYQAELERYQQIQQRLALSKAQAGQAVSLNQMNQDWQRKMDQSQLQNEYQSQIARAQTRLSELENEYQKLQKQDTEQRAELGRVYQDFEESKESS